MKCKYCNLEMQKTEMMGTSKGGWCCSKCNIALDSEGVEF